MNPLRKTAIIPAVQILRDRLHRGVEFRHEPTKSNTYPHPKESYYCQDLLEFLISIDMDYQIIIISATDCAFNTEEQEAVRNFKRWLDQMWTYTIPGAPNSSLHKKMCELPECIGYTCSIFSQNEELSLKVAPSNLHVEWVHGKRKVTILS